MRKQRTYYSLDFKIKAVELSQHRGNMASVAKELNIRPESLQRWKKAYQEGNLNVEQSIPKHSEDQELKKLEKIFMK